MKEIKGAIFILDGIIVDTAKYHYLAWKRLAQSLGFNFTEIDHERLKGISRMRSLEMLLELGNYIMTEDEKLEAAEKKNAWYLEYINALDESSLLPGVKDYLDYLSSGNMRIALCSASKNVQIVLKHLHITQYFDAIIDGNYLSKPKPDPDIFLKSAQALSLSPQECMVFENTHIGIQAAKSAEMKVIVIGSKQLLPGADMYINSLEDMLPKT